MTPLVSIAIPAYRPGPVFRETLASCLQQDWPNLEVVVAPDGDDAEVRAIVESAGDTRVRLLPGGTRWGQFANFNRAIDATRGEYVKLLSADDLMARDCLSRMVEALVAHPEIGLCAARHLAFCTDEAGRPVDRVEVPEQQAPAVLVVEAARAGWYTALHGNQFGGPSNVMLRRSALWLAGTFDPRIGHLGDWAYWVRVARRTGMLVIHRPLIGYRIHANSVTARDGSAFVRVDEPFSIAEDATVGAYFPNPLWCERQVRRLHAVQSTMGYVASGLARRPLEGLAGLWRVVSCGGLLLAPAMAVVALWALLRTGLARSRSQWPFRDPTVLHRLPPDRIDPSAIVALLSDPASHERLLRGERA